MKRILFISHYSGCGGANRSMIFLINTLKPMGVSPLVFLPAHGPVEQLLRQYEIPYEVHRYASLRTADRGYIRNKVEALFRLLLNIVQAIALGLRNKNKIDVIHSNSSLVFLGVFMKLVMHKPLVWHLREFGCGDYDMIFSLGQRVSRWFYRKADIVIAISKAIEHYYKQNVYDGSNLMVIYNGVDESSIQCKLACPKQSLNREIRMCIVGGISESKNQIEIIDALQLLQNPTIELDIIGDGVEEYVDHLKQTIKDKKLDGNVKFLGKKENVGEILRNYDIGIIASKNEAFGRVTIEYMLACVPVIASEAGANIELIENGKNGILYKLGDANDLALKIKMLAEDVQLRCHIATNAYNYAIYNYTAKINAQKILQIYNKLDNHE